MQRPGSSPARHRSGASNLATLLRQASNNVVNSGLQRQPSASALQRQPSSSVAQRQSNASGIQRQGSGGSIQRHPSVAALQRQLSNSLSATQQASLTALLRQGSSPALQRRSEQSPALQRPGTAPYRAGASSPAMQRSGTAPNRAGASSPAMQRPGTASAFATQHQGTGTGLSGPDRTLKPASLAALLRQASSPGLQRPEGAAAIMQRQGGKQGSSQAAQGPEVSPAVMLRQGGQSNARTRCSSPALQRPESSGSGRPQRAGSRAGAVRGNSPALQRHASLPPPVVAADFARKDSNGLTAVTSGDLAARGDRVSTSSSASSSLPGVKTLFLHIAITCVFCSNMFLCVPFGVCCAVGFLLSPVWPKGRTCCVIVVQAVQNMLTTTKMCSSASYRYVPELSCPLHTDLL